MLFSAGPALDKRANEWRPSAGLAALLNVSVESGLPNCQTRLSLEGAKESGAVAI
jgi:hypothetical protein